MINVTKKDNHWYLIEGMKVSYCLYFQHWIGACWHTARIGVNIAIDKGLLEPKDTILWNVVSCALGRIPLQVLRERLFAEKAN